ncbi:hypothetical protein Dimus_037135 [Dionaea muscipula]
MAEKGGKGFSAVKGGKSSSQKNLSSKDALLKGKGDDSAKSKGRKVQFSNEASPQVNLSFTTKHGGKLDTPMGEFSQGGKGGKAANGGKGSLPKEPAKYELNTAKDVPSNAQCLMDCEAADILEGIQEQMTFLSVDPTIKIPVSFDKGLQYAKSGGRYTNPESVRKVLEKLKEHDVSDGEICLIANVYPDTVDEVFALVTSLKGKRSKLSEPLKDVLTELASLKNSSAAFKL